MKLTKKVAAGLLLGIGLPITLLLVGDFLRKDNQNKAGDVVLFVVFGLPLTVTGGLLARSLYQEGQKLKFERDKEVRDRLQTIFYRLLEEGKGHITIMRFAMETQLSGEDAKQYLDEKAIEFDAIFDVNSDGGVSYCFNLDEISSRQLTVSREKVSEQKTLDV